ncbi:DNA topology modulation protein FlaR [Gottfriedia solisilvae]|uniref:DNA topology modulation protein FlaR n=1 Tax=Gottfriedia solisilvae TaxID=1516104 RepID=A0A8J3AKH8_9BACI|nr:DNA topology modulation protein FlaR [Gottfriedia solisilvae]GGI16257.1 DNA topology modulation protein FlaR [Gottfriedia solisilvae]
MKNKPKRIHIIGSVGSGKTTLAKNISNILSIPYYELDNIVWKRTSNGDIRNSMDDRDAIFQNIIGQDYWIVEGVHYEWVKKSFELADMILLLDVSKKKRKYRILKRFILQRLNIEKANYKPTLKMLRKMYKWNHNFELLYKPDILNMLKQYNHKVYLLKDNKDIDKLLH